MGEQLAINFPIGNQFNVIQAMSGPEALKIIQTNRKLPDFILLDWMMPQMSGLEVCEKLRQYYPMCDLPIIMVSAKSQPDQIAEGLSKVCKNKEREKRDGEEAERVIEEGYHQFIGN